MSQMKTPDGRRKYNFHVKVSERGPESDVANKVRVWTFCGSKGCEAECVVVFGYDMGDTARVTSLNQMGVALSRAKSRLIVIHGQAFKAKARVPLGYYPLLGDTDCAPGNASELKARSKRAQAAIERFVLEGVVKPDPSGMPTATEITEEQPYEQAYEASNFTHFSASETRRFLARAQWTTESRLNLGVAKEDGGTINYASEVSFEQTSEDVSAIYGNALPYMLQWEVDGYCPQVETLVYDGLLCFSEQKVYSDQDVGDQIMRRSCELMSDRDTRIFRAAFTAVTETHGKVSGKVLIRMFRQRIHLTKKRILECGREITFRVKAVEERVLDEIMQEHVPKIAEMYRATAKSAAGWAYIANAVAAFDSYHDKFKQV